MLPDLFRNATTGLSFSQVALSVGNHAADLPELTHAVKSAAVADSSREGLTDAWKQWIQAAGARHSPVRGDSTDRPIRCKPATDVASSVRV